MLFETTFSSYLDICNIIIVYNDFRSISGSILKKKKKNTDKKNKKKRQ